MKFTRIIGKIDPALIAKAEEALSAVFLDLALKGDNGFTGSAIGGDPLVFSLIYPMQHVATMNIPTAGTDGKRYYWNPEFVLSTLSKGRIGLRIVCAHEAWHAIYMHPQRRGGRHRKLWNIAVDFIVNGTIMEDLKSRKQDPVKLFKTYLGNFFTLDEYAEYIKDPFKFVKKDQIEEPIAELPKADDDRDLTEQEKQELERLKKKEMYFFADPNLPDDMKKPERIYDYLYGLLPKCDKCGRIGIYKRPKPTPTQSP